MKVYRTHIDIICHVEADTEEDAAQLFEDALNDAMKAIERTEYVKPVTYEWQKIQIVPKGNND